MRFGWDLDGCAVQFDPTLRNYLVKHAGWSVEQCPPATRWEFYLDWGLSVEEFVDACNQAADFGVLFNGQPEPGVIAAANRVIREGHELHIVTDRQFGQPGRSKTLTLSWLIRNGHPYTSLTMSADKTVVPCDVFIEDKPENYAALRRAGVDAYLLNRPWNVGSLEWRDAHNRGRIVESTAQYVDKVLASIETSAAAA